MFVLVVEDDASLAEALADAFRDEGHEVRTESDGILGWRALHDRLPDVVVLDLMMPNLDGQAFRRRQLATPELAPIPTLVLTGQPVTAEMRFAGLGTTPVLSKPFPLGNLLAAIAELTTEIDHRRAKGCACGALYSADEWRSLAWVAVIDNGRDVGEELELRNCARCGSTIAWQLGRHAISVQIRR